MSKKNNVVSVDFEKRKQRYVLGCPECDGVDWNVLIDPDQGADVLASPDDDVDFECIGIQCVTCGFTVDMNGYPTPMH
tara:strand:+ start:169 stop:402 length:234 start_codon:yes stop_codon:yes gene_type:complete